MIEGITVLSLFDGMSCGQIALERAGIKVKQYYASEIEKPAIKVTQHNYPNTIQIGDVTKVSYKDGFLYTEKGNFEVGKIDLLIGGSPCQSFSVSGDGSGFNGKSGLFYHWLRIKEEVNPEYFLLENVKMKKDWSDEISKLIGVKPVLINSLRFSAQSRNRLYWSNLTVNTIPYQGQTVSQIAEGVSYDIGIDAVQRQLCSIMSSSKYRNSFNIRKDKTGRYLITRPDGLKIQHVGRISHSDSYCEIITKTTTPFIICDGVVRKVTPLEAERLQTVPDNYTACLPDSQAYAALGNGWTVDVIAHIFKGMDLEKGKKCL